MDKALIIKHAKMELARREFWHYCKFTSPEFYREDRPFLRDFAEKFQWFIEESPAQIMVVNVPPRHGIYTFSTPFYTVAVGELSSNKDTAFSIESFVTRTYRSMVV